MTRQLVEVGRDLKTKWWLGEQLLLWNLLQQRRCGKQDMLEAGKNPPRNELSEQKIDGKVERGEK